MGRLEEALLDSGGTGKDNEYRWGTVTQVSPLRVRLDGESAPLAITPESLVAVDLGFRVWCQLYDRQLVVLGVSSASRTTKEIRYVGSAKRTTSTTNATSLFNVVTYTLPQALTVTGTKFRISAACNIAGDTAGAYSDLQILIGANASIGGTWLAGYYWDHRIAGRIGAAAIPNFEYTYAEAQNVANMNIVLVINPSAGSLVSASATRPSYLTVDRIMP